jgi:hypothetical protein
MWAVRERGAPAFLKRFQRQRLIGIILSMLQPLEERDPFDLLLERDSSRTARPDLVFISEKPRAPVVGLVQVHPQREYGNRGRHRIANESIQRLVTSREMARVPIDTRMDTNSTGLRTESEVESLVARMDVVVTTRLHGLVLALKNGVPALAIDPVAGGAKIRRQAEAIGWPVVLRPRRLLTERSRKPSNAALRRRRGRKLRGVAYGPSSSYNT